MTSTRYKNKIRNCRLPQTVYHVFNEARQDPFLTNKDLFEILQYGFDKIKSDNVVS